MKSVVLRRFSAFTLLLGVIFLPFWSTTAVALTIDGHEIPSVIPATSHHPELKLNGAAMRVLYAVVDTYIGKLYVETPTTDEDAIIKADEFKRMVFHVAMKRISGRRIAKAMYDALQLNLTAEEALALEDRLRLLVDLFDVSLRRGEEGYIEWVPGTGSRIVINDKEMGIIPGKDLSDAILKIWIGDNPVGNTFKNQILGIEQYQAPKKLRRRGRR